MQLTVMTCMVLVAEALALQIRRPWKKSATLLALLLLALAVGAGLQAVQFFSTRDMLPMTFRGRPNFEGFTQLGYTLAQAPALLFPMLFGAYGSQALIHQNYFLDGYQIEMVGSMGAVAWLGILLLALSRSGLRDCIFIRSGGARSIFGPPWASLRFRCFSGATLPSPTFYSACLSITSFASKTAG